MPQAIQDLISNEVAVAAFLSWFIAQFLKIVLSLIVEKRINLKRFVEAGGMPSSHTSTTVGAAVACARAPGLASPVFALAAILAIVVMYDAAGVRREAGRHAEALNDIAALNENFGLKLDPHLKELLGHTPIEVMAGFAVGLITGIMVAWL